jgi:CheY-like chemotaxis protein
MAVEDLLADQGCEVLSTASTVKEALLRINEDQPEVVILDRNLDGDRTTEVALALNRDDIPYLVMTGYSQGTADEPAMAAAPCIQKPWNATVLLQHLAKMIS